ncbi:MAG: Arm DNA-binding domain-containing protein [Rikenellaceae bacterium]
MATTKMYLDCRASRIDGSAPIKINISHNNTSALISIDTYIMPSQWDRISGKVVSHPNKQFLNNHIIRRKIEVDNEIMKHTGI